MKLLWLTLCSWPRAVFTGQAFALVAFSVIAAPAPCGGAWPLRNKNPAKPVPASRFTGTSKTPDSPASLTRTLPEHADSLPSEYRPADADLQLNREGSRKAVGMSEFAMALLAEDSADTERALAGYRKALESDPGYSELAIKVAYDLVQRKEVSTAIQVLKDAIKASPKDARAFVYLSRIYDKNLRKPDLALKYAEQAIAFDPDNVDCIQLLFDLQTAGNQPKKAEQLIERAAAILNPDPKYWLQLGDLYKRLYLKADGSQSPQDLVKVNAIFRKAAELGKTDTDILSKAGDYFILSRQVKEAIPLYLAALNQTPTPDDSPPNNLREKLARAFLLTEQSDEAIRLLESVAKDNPMRFETFELLGDLYAQKGDSGKAFTNYERSLKLNSNDPRAYVRLSEILLRAKRTDEAVTTMQNARVRFPEQPEIAFSLASTLSLAKQHTQAMTVFAEAEAEAQGVHDEILGAQFYFQYGVAAEQAGRLEKAAELLKRSIELDPANAAQSYNYLGYMWADRGENLVEAGEMIRKALGLEPENAAFLDSLGWLHFKQANYDEAIQELLRAAARIKPADAVVLDHVGDTYQALGKTAEALSYWKKAVAIEKENPVIAAKISAATQAPAPENASGTRASP